MENLYKIESVEISHRSIKGDMSSFTPNHWSNKRFTFENLNFIVQQTLDQIKERYGKDFFQKLVVTMTYSPVGTDLQHCIQSGHDEKGEIYCFQYCKVVYLGVLYRYEYNNPHFYRLAWYGCSDDGFACNLDDK